MGQRTDKILSFLIHITKLLSIKAVSSCFLIDRYESVGDI